MTDIREGLAELLWKDYIFEVDEVEKATDAIFTYLSSQGIVQKVEGIGEFSTSEATKFQRNGITNIYAVEPLIEGKESIDRGSFAQYVEEE